IPFCRKACVYCDFHFSTSLRQKDAMLQALQREIQLRNDLGPTAPTIESIYFGGGTPSVLSANEIRLLIDEITQKYPVASHAEITLEANPDDLDQAYLTSLAQTPINRLSIGVQSFDESVLQAMNRSHNQQQAISAVKMAQDQGFHNITIDLIFAIPQQITSIFEENLTQALSLGVPHMAVYALTIEEKTALAHQVKTGKVRPAEDQVYETEFTLAHEVLTAHGFDHYELSNYAQPGAHAVHNGNYWKGVSYLGIGPSAHSYHEGVRSWNKAHNARYIQALQQDQLAVEDQETLTQADRYHEYIMTHLRKKEGIDPDWIRTYGIENWDLKYDGYIQQWISQGLMQKVEGKYACTPQGWLVSDHMISELFLD
ncbi:MAG: radical SAM family heme chaperone HemW, partial [Bacteroidota bacterium]